MKKSYLVIALMLLSGACSKVQELDKRTHNMEKSTEKMSSTTDNMEANTSAMYQQVRSGDTAALRLKSYEHMTQKGTAAGDKIADACIYFKAMEFQLWTDNQSFDNDHMRDALYLDAANEFTKRLTSTYDKLKKRVNKMSPTNTSQKHSDEQVFYAFGVSLHMNHHWQEDLVTEKKSELQTVSMYDLVKSALSKDHSGSYDLKEHEEILVNGENKEMLIELLKARVDMLSALALKNLTDKDQMTLGQKAKGALFKITGGLLGSINLPVVYSKSNEPTKKWTEKYLEAAVKTQDFLRSIEVEKRLEKTLRSAFKNINFNEQENSGEPEQKADPRREAIKGYIQKLVE